MISRRGLRTTAWLTLVLIPAMLLGVSQPAQAHANLVRTDPAEGAVLPTAPDQIRFTFDEAVRGVPHGVQIFDAQGDLVEASATIDGTDLKVGLSKDLGKGTTVITWRVVSDDGHPIRGALTFSVGAPSREVTPVPAETSSTSEAPWTLTAVRWVGYTGLLLATGLIIFAAMFRPGAAPGSRLVIAKRAAAAVTVAAWLAVLPITAIYLLGGGPDLLGQGSTWSSLPLTDYVVSALVIGGSVVAVLLSGAVSRPPPRSDGSTSQRPVGAGTTSRGRRIAAVIAAAVAVTAPALVGHTRAASPEVLVIGADALHLLAGSVWLGGVIGLALTLPALSHQGTAAAELLTRFSTAAAGVLAALVATGALLAWRILGSWSALVGTGYGRLLLIKIAIVLAALAIAAWNRWSLLPRLRQASKPAGRQARAHPVMRATAAEGAVLVVALLITGLLVDTSPEAGAAPTSAAAETDPGTRTTTLGDIQVRADVTPLTRGPNTVTLRLTTATGEPTEGVAPPVVRLASDQAALGDVPLAQVSPGVYTAEVMLPVSGTWRLQVSLRVSDFANPVGELEFPVS
jgi:copper transport protein